MAELKVLNDAGQQAATVQAPDALFAREYNEALVHQVVVAYQANARQGTRAQKDRTLVKHTTRKPWRQKGTGRARAGMSSSPLWRGGGRIFPNSPDENFSQKVNRMGLDSVLVITDELDENLFLSSRNLHNVLVLEAHETDPVSLIRFGKVLVTRSAMSKFEEMWA